MVNGLADSGEINYKLVTRKPEHKLIYTTESSTNTGIINSW